MKIRYNGQNVILEAEDGETRVRNESDLFFRLRNVLRAQGYDVIKKEAAKDGHMVAEGVFYVRTRSMESRNSFAFYDARYAERDVALDYNLDGIVKLRILGRSPERRGGPKDWRPR